ncbi:uncharacterized protein LOC110846733 [Folsomia candida]|uniref:Prohormone-1 n=1 Tax=Folsomia candida TaxID=158441 RepID=A0A226EKT3_FOLCA|nr:uncharacterized protein LOC110846733 [Folsomia candida]XP_035705955.1 uncharacterized protein LOC110846733 [Folsomia candida]OXA57351.1 Prohormone-1 [Folsomia candida]
MVTAAYKTSWTVLILPFIVVVMATLISASPSGSPSSEDLLGSRVYYRNRETLSNPEDNVVPITLDAGQQSSPMLYDPHVLSAQAPSDNALITYLLTRRFALANNNRLRSYVDSSSNEISRKRSYSKYCAFNAVSCFGKK